MKLFIGNKNYSSWSFRVWLTLKVHDIAFEEDLRPFDVENEYADFFEFAPHGKVPVLLDDRLTVWETMAILEYLAERFPDAGLWPYEFARRAEARAIANEMHAGFLALRTACPMNMRRRIEPIPINREVKKDIARIEQIWGHCLKKHGGPYLFGERFTIADGMFAPIVNRFEIYELSNHPAVQSYSKTLKAIPAWKEWSEASAKEPWTIDIDEIYA